MKRGLADNAMAGALARNAKPSPLALARFEPDKLSADALDDAALHLLAHNAGPLPRWASARKYSMARKGWLSRDKRTGSFHMNWAGHEAACKAEGRDPNGEQPAFGSCDCAICETVRARLPDIREPGA